MEIPLFLVLLCCCVLLGLVQPASVSDGDGKELILDKLNVLQQKLDAIERKIVENDAKLDSFERTIKDKLEELDKKLSLTGKVKNDTKTAPIYRSCKDVSTKVSGIYQIQLEPNEKPISVYCDQIVEGGGWIVFQNRYKGQVDFFRNWTEYRDGFGDLDGEFWLGLKYLHKLTSARRHELMVLIRDFDGNNGYAYHDRFAIGDESEKFKLKVVGNYRGTAGDSLANLVDSSFTTKDNDNDEMDDGNCAVLYEGAWWYYACSSTNLNGPYGDRKGVDATMKWFAFKLDGRAMSGSRMMIREVS